MGLDGGTVYYSRRSFVSRKLKHTQSPQEGFSSEDGAMSETLSFPQCHKAINFPRESLLICELQQLLGHLLFIIMTVIDPVI